MQAGEPVMTAKRSGSSPYVILFSSTTVEELKDWSEPVTVRIVEFPEGELVMVFKRHECEGD